MHFIVGSLTSFAEETVEHAFENVEGASPVTIRQSASRGDEEQQCEGEQPTDDCDGDDERADYGVAQRW
jgi:hypothetical protein